MTATQTIVDLKQDLEALEGTIRTNLKAFYEVGRALLEIRDRKLYCDVKGYGTFEEYCRAEWDMSKRHAYRLMDSCQVVETLKSDQLVTVTPTTESQARPLAKIKDPEQQREVWQQAVETAPEGKVTARHVAKVVSSAVNEQTQRKAAKIERATQQVAVSPEFKEAYRTFYREVQNAKLEGWKGTNKEKALELVKYIVDLITIGNAYTDTDNDHGTKPRCTATEARQFAHMAITNLRQIRDDDPERQEALDSVVEWTNDHRERGD